MSYPSSPRPKPFQPMFMTAALMACRDTDPWPTKSCHWHTHSTTSTVWYVPLCSAVASSLITTEHNVDCNTALSSAYKLIVLASAILANQASSPGSFLSRLKVICDCLFMPKYMFANRLVAQKRMRQMELRGETFSLAASFSLLCLRIEML